MVEHVALAEQFERQRHEEDQVRRVAAMDHVEAAREQDLHRQHELPKQGGRILGQVAQAGLGVLRHRVPIDLDAVEQLGTFVRRRAERADDGDHRPGVAQGARLLPDPAIERDRQVFHDDQNAPAGKRSGLGHRGRGGGGFVALAGGCGAAHSAK